MVPLDPVSFEEWVRGLKLLKRGAESEVRLGEYMGRPSVFKLRVVKPYMDRRLGEMLASQRTIKEASIIAHALKLGVPAPMLYAVYPSLRLIVMEYIEGPTLKDVLSAGGAGGSGASMLVEAGRILARLHSSGIAHGDPTTSNYIAGGEGLVLIDYGLSEYSTDVEDMAVDVHLFRRSVESTHASIAGEAFKLFARGYSAEYGEGSERVFSRAEEIRLRGRYVEERRRTVWRDRY